MDTLLQDLRYALRMLIKSPGFTAAAVLSLALGIGANTAIFSIVNAVLLKALPYNEPDRIALIWGAQLADGNLRGQASFTDVDDWRKQNDVFEDIAAYTSWRPILSGAGEPERLPAMQVSDGYFSILKSSPLLGRDFTPEDQIDGNDFVVILSCGLWRQKFGGDPGVIGRTIALNSRTYTIVGVMPAGLRSLPTTLVDAPAELYRPLAETHDEQDRASRHVRAIARLKPNTGFQQAQTEMSAIAARLEQEHPASNTNYGVRVVALTEDTIGDFRTTLVTLFGAVVFVLLIACANVGNLMLARSVVRQKEIAIRAALGAGRSRLVRQLLTESVTLALAGGAVGVLVALWGVGAIQSLGAKAFSQLGAIAIDNRVLAFTALLSVLSGVAFGLAPALHVSRTNLNETLKEGSRGGSSSASQNRLRGALVVAEIALSLILLICAGLLIKSVARLHGVNPGFDPENLLSMNVGLPSAKYPEPHSWITFYDQITERVRTLPGVKGAAAVSVLPLSRNFDGRTITVEEHPAPPGQDPDADLYVVTPGYLETMNIPLVRGRGIGPQDVERAEPIALVSETMARDFWPGEDPIGKRFKMPGSPANPQPWRTVVGVVVDVKQKSLDTAGKRQFYLPEAQFPGSYMTLVARTGSDPSALISAVRAEVLAVDPEQPVYDVATMEQLLHDSIAIRRFATALLGIFAAVALALAAIGIYGVLSYSVRQRTREVGIRVALGAQPRDVLTLMMKQGSLLTLTGVVIGLAAAFALTGLLASLLFGVSATDPMMFTLVPLLLASIALLASYIPARRATKVDPVIALRCE